MKPLKGLIDLQAVRRNVLIRELCKRGVKYDIAAIAASGYVHSSASTMVRWGTAIRRTRLRPDQLAEALLAAGLRS